MDKFVVYVDGCQTAADYAQYTPFQLSILASLATLILLVIVATTIELAYRSDPKSKLLKGKYSWYAWHQYTPGYY